MSKDGQIKREDIILPEALNWADDYKKSVQEAIQINRKFIESMSEIQELQKQTKPTFTEKEASLFKKRLNLLTIVLDTILDTKQKTEVFNLLKRIENLEQCEYQTMFTSNGNVYLTIPNPIVLTEKEVFS
jgi:predicted RND superfamily exporter protein